MAAKTDTFERKKVTVADDVIPLSHFHKLS